MFSAPCMRDTRMHVSGTFIHPSADSAPWEAWGARTQSNIPLLQPPPHTASQPASLKLKLLRRVRVSRRSGRMLQQAL